VSNRSAAGTEIPAEHKGVDLLDVRQLRLFEALHATRSVTGAAEMLGQSQPTVSIWLGKMRASMRDRLFVRGTNGMEPTPKAIAMRESVCNILAALRALSDVEPLFDPASSDRSFRICMSDASHITLMPELLARVRAEAPNVHLVVDRIDETTRDELESGRCDIGLGYIPELHNGFREQALFAQDWICICAANHPRIGKALDLAGYLAEGHIRIPHGAGHDLIELALRRRHVRRRVVLELPGFLGLSGLVSNTDLLVTLPREIGETLAHIGGLRVLACPLSVPKFLVRQYWHSRYDAEPGGRWLRGVCASLFLQKGIRSPRLLLKN
jgi:DNA-binding transcriptional LysR family regulator